MHIGNRLFPYPVLNRNQELSDYGEEMTFSFSFDTDESGCPIINEKELILPNLHYDLHCPYLESLVEEGLADVALITECSASLYRRKTDLGPSGVDLRFSLSDFTGDVSLSCYVYATADLPSFTCGDFIADFEGASFEIDKYDILAVDDGVTFRVDLDAEDDNKIASIFTVVKIEDESLKRISYESGEKGINILLPSTYYDCYDNMKMHASYNNITFAMMAIPVLSSCLEDIKVGSFEDIDEIIDAKQWFTSVCFGYKRSTGQELDYQTFLGTSSFEIAQIVLNDASCRGINDFNEFLLGAHAVEQDEMEVGNE